MTLGAASAPRSTSKTVCAVESTMPAVLSPCLLRKPPSWAGLIGQLKMPLILNVLLLKSASLRS